MMECTATIACLVVRGYHDLCTVAFRNVPQYHRDGSIVACVRFLDSLEKGG